MVKFWTNEETIKKAEEIEEQYKENKNKDFKDVSARSEKLCEEANTTNEKLDEWLLNK
jgi:hypothetical protein